MRKKISDDKKKEKFAVSIDENLIDMLGKLLDKKEISNKSKYIENLIRKDMEERGENVKRDF
jgi:metal-responsive CopG/Arc/MetJ family transcriptional regulator